MQSATKLATEKFPGYFDVVQNLHRSTLGRALEMYKATEPDCVMQAFERIWSLEARGAAFVGKLVNELVWPQCLGNGNHRTTILFVRTFLDSASVQFPVYAAAPDADQRFEASLNAWINRSQALIRRRGEPGFAQARLAPKHREITLAWTAAELGNQSEALTIIGPQRLMDFISRSEMSG